MTTTKGTDEMERTYGRAKFSLTFLLGTNGSVDVSNCKKELEK